MSKHILRQGEPMSKLTPKQEMFAKEYLIDLSATQAAVRAGYSKRTARSQGQRLLTNVDIAKAIAAGQAKRGKRTEIDADYVLTTIRDTIERCKQAVPVLRDGEETGEWTFNPTAVLKGAELLGRHLAMFTDKAVVDVNHGLQEMTDTELEAHARRLAEKVGGTLPKNLITPTKVR